ncbi:MAG: heavy metal translocating P-type ATPase [Rhodospirillaceae bacterium]|nr:heavy metal translocating P-type ATPase [Rhodospirillaceae bacterium]
MADVAVHGFDSKPAHDEGPAVDPTAYVRTADDGTASLHLMIENLHCANCVRQIESTLTPVPGVVEARVNLTTRRLFLRWQTGAAQAADLVARVAAQGYRLVPFDPAALASAADDEDKKLLRAMAVAGFAAANVMLLSVSVWAGAWGADMSTVTRDFLHWISALIALPAVAYAGRPFFRSAAGALSTGRLNMDVPISLAVILAAGMSLYETMNSGVHAYFDASVTLLFFLLIGRYLDRRARGKARSAAEQLMVLGATAATVVDETGRQRAVPVANVEPGMTVAVAAGERIPVDGTIIAGRSDIDTSLVTGESLPKAVSAGALVHAGTLNLGAPLDIRVTAAGEGTLLADIVRLMEAAEQGRARYVRIADRVAAVYAPAVHILAAVTFLGWLVIGGADWQVALMNAIAVLIITCPCALGLAVPAVQVVASGRLLKLGVLLKSADGLERLAGFDTVVFDKTGTLTLGRPELVAPEAVAPEDLALAASLAMASRHPLARALTRAAPDVPALAGVHEEPGMGLRAETEAGEVRLGNRLWCGCESETGTGHSGPELWLSRPGGTPVRFTFTDRLRADAAEVVGWFHARGHRVVLLSGDRPSVVEAVAAKVSIDDWRAELTPRDKVGALDAMQAEGRHVLMIGDGLNDAPALGAAFVSMSPSSAADVSRTAADLVFQGDKLAPVVEAIRVARSSKRLVFQNFGLALLYNAIAIPLAMAGLITPLIAAVAMSSSSLAVTGNALRLNFKRALR